MEKQSGLVTALDPLPTPGAQQESQLSHLNPVSRNEDKNALCQMKNIFLIRFHFGVCVYACVCTLMCMYACMRACVCVHAYRYPQMPVKGAESPGAGVKGWF